MKSTVLNSRGFNASIITMGTTVEVGNLDISDSSGIITGYIGDPITPFEISTLYGITRNIQEQLTNNNNQFFSTTIPQNMDGHYSGITGIFYPENLFVGSHTGPPQSYIYNVQQCSVISQVWLSITSDSTGQYLAAGALDGTVYYSVDFGAVWNLSSIVGDDTSTLYNWTSITSSSDGTIMYISNYVFTNPSYTLNVYQSTDHGAHWNNIYSTPVYGSSTDYICLACDATGSKLNLMSSFQVIGESTGVYYLYRVEKSGNTWNVIGVDTDISINNVGVISSMSLDANGSKLAIAFQYEVYILDISGATLTWSTSSPDFNNTSQYWTNIAMSTDGKYIIVGVGNLNSSSSAITYISSDGGNSWTEFSFICKNSVVSIGIYAVAIDSTGRHYTINIIGDYSYVSSDYGNTWTIVSGTYNLSITNSISNTDSTLLAGTSIDGPIYTINRIDNRGNYISVNGSILATDDISGNNGMFNTVVASSITLSNTSENLIHSTPAIYGNKNNTHYPVIFGNDIAVPIYENTSHLSKDYTRPGTVGQIALFMSDINTPSLFACTDSSNGLGYWVPIVPYSG